MLKRFRLKKIILFASMSLLVQSCMASNEKLQAREEHRLSDIYSHLADYLDKEVYVIGYLYNRTGSLDAPNLVLLEKEGDKQLNTRYTYKFSLWLNDEELQNHIQSVHMCEQHYVGVQGKISFNQTARVFMIKDIKGIFAIERDYSKVCF